MTRSRTGRRRPSRRQSSRGNRNVGKSAGPRRAGNRLRLGAAASSRTRLRLTLLFVLSLVAGIGLAEPVEKQIAEWAENDFGMLERMAIQGNHRLSFAEIAATTGIRRGTSLAAIETSVIAERLVREAWIREADVLRLPPSTLLIRVEEREPRALLLPRPGNTEGTGPRLVDASGHVFIASTGDEALPRLVGGEWLDTNGKHAVLVKALALFEQLQTPELSRLGDFGEELLIYLPVPGSSEGWRLRGRVDVVLGQRELIPRIHRLTQLMQTEEILSARGNQRLLIDLRFAEQAVLRAGEKNPNKGPAAS